MRHEKRIERFESRIDKSGDCWIWQGRARQGGYGYLGWCGENERAHRVAWMIAHGPIPNGLCVCHTCDNPLCVRPSHLWLGTQLENNEDKVRKGRQHGRPRLPVRACAVENCGRRAYAKNIYCPRCVRRLERHGDPTAVHRRGRKGRR